MNSWKTTSAGLLTIIGALVTLWFHRAGLTPEIVMGCATAVLTGIGLILARDNDKTSEDVGAKPAATSAGSGNARGVALLLLCLSLAGVGLWAGCQAPPQRIAYNTVAAPAVTADHAMQVWGDYVKQFHPPVSQERAVLDDYRKYRAAELAAIDSAHLAADSMSSTNFTAVIHSPEASQALDDLVALIRKFGAKL